MPNHLFPYLRLIILGLSIVFCSPGPAPGELAVHYDAAILGVDDKSVLETLQGVSNTFAFKERPPATLSLLEHRARTDIPEMVSSLKSMGYYAAEIEVSIDEKKEPPLVTFRVNAGPPYLLHSVIIESAKPAQAGAPLKLPAHEEIGLTLYEPAQASLIKEAEGKLVALMRKRGHPFAAVREQRVVVDHQTRTVAVTFPVVAGPRAAFGPTTVNGLTSVSQDYVKGLIPWREGDSFNPELLTQLQKRLVETRLFSLVQFKEAESLDGKGRLPITLEVKERDHRTISVGATYHTDEGPGGKIAWEHRNLFHGGELLRVEAAASGLGYSGEAIFKKPAFLRQDQTLAITSRLALDDTDAYVSRNLDSALLVEREIRKGMKLGLGPGFRLARVDEAAPFRGVEDFSLLYFKTYYQWDTSDNLLDPSRGGRLDIQLAPYMDTLDNGAGFVKGRTSYARYFKISDKPFLLLAGRAAVGTILGTDRDSVPADLRFYSGGGGSIRGFAFQLAGPLVGEDPVGGKSMLELGMELRTKVTEKIGLVAFADGGSAFESSLPDFSETLRWGAGVGVRYFTPIGPLRLDFAVPLNPREGIDDPFQIYLSIGQAF